MKNWPLLLLLFTVSAPAHAESRPLDLNLDTSGFYKEAAEESSWMQDKNYQSPAEQLLIQCQEMREQIKALNGKPQRKFALQQRYESECQKLK